jgi:hypothetical protein
MVTRQWKSEGVTVPLPLPVGRILCKSHHYNGLGQESDVQATDRPINFRPFANDLKAERGFTTQQAGWLSAVGLFIGCVAVFGGKLGQ